MDLTEEGVHDVYCHVIFAILVQQKFAKNLSIHEKTIDLRYKMYLVSDVLKSLYCVTKMLFRI